MVVAEPVLTSRPPQPFGAMVARQLSVWPFGARTQRLFLLLDPPVIDPDLRSGLLRAMQQAYFRSDSFSQTRAVREGALAAHYVLRHHNRDVLLTEQVMAASCVAAVRGGLAYVALAGDAAAFTWRDRRLTGQRVAVRVSRPLGGEQDPTIALRSALLEPGDRLVLVCGATWRPESMQTIEEVLGNSEAGDDVTARLAEALGDGRPAGVLIADPARPTRPDRHLVLVSSVERGRAAVPVGRTVAAPRVAPASPARHPLALVSSALALVMLAGITLAALNPFSEPSHESLAHQAQTLLAQAGDTVDPYAAHALAASAYDLTQHASVSATDLGDLADQAARKLEQIDRVVPVDPNMAVRLGPSGGNVVDLAVGDTAFYTLDVIEASVRTFSLDAQDQQPTPETVLARAGGSMPGLSRRLANPVAMGYLRGARPGSGVLTIIDQARSIVEVDDDRVARLRPLPSSGSWGELGALGVDDAGQLYVLDSGARRLLAYPFQNRQWIDSPRVLLDDNTAPDLPFDRAAEIVAEPGEVFLRMDDGTLHRYSSSAGQSVLVVRPPDGRPMRVASMTSDRAGGLYLVDAADARIVETTTEGSFIRQLRNPALAGLRQIQSSPDGHRIYGLVASGVLVFDVPDLQPPS